MIRVNDMSAKTGGSALSRPTRNRQRMRLPMILLGIVLVPALLFVLVLPISWWQVKAEAEKQGPTRLRLTCIELSWRHGCTVFYRNLGSRGYSWLIIDGLGQWFRVHSAVFYD